MAGGREAPAAEFVRRGFVEPARAESLLRDPVLVELDGPDREVLLDRLGVVADPDQALLGVVRLLESAGPNAGPLRDVLRTPGAAGDRIVGVLGGSSALVDHLCAHPEHWLAAAEAAPLDTGARVAAMRSAVLEPGERSGDDALRVEYRRQLVAIAAADLTEPDPAHSLPETAAALADLAEAALEAALAIAEQEHPEAAALCALCVIGMGKTGGRELNYVSDVDVIFVGEPRGDADEPTAMAAAAVLATRLMRACSAATGEGTLWPVDAALRPEGKAGQLVRTVDGHAQYYERWAKTWEFQALLKARPLAGDPDLGARYLEAVTPKVWSAAGRPDFVQDVQAMRRRVEEHVPAAEAARQIKLGPGGLRDVEFSVQLLQLVHGRSDPALRSGTTLDALAALSAGGYVGRDDATALDAAYRRLRTLEHRIQLQRLRRTHLMPTAEADLRRLGRALGHRSDPAAAVTKKWQEDRREVRRIHERLFYRPLLSAVARLSSDEARLAPEAARDRLAALGFRDPRGALKHLETLTAGVSRRAAIQRTLLPVMLGWFADESDPDAGLLAFRKVSDELGSSHWYLKMLRDEGGAAERLAHVLGRSRFVGELLVGAPEAVQLLGEGGGLRPRSREELIRRMTAAAGRRDSASDKAAAIRAVRRAELFRVAVADLDGSIQDEGVPAALTDLSVAVIATTLDVAVAEVEARLGPLGTDLLVIGMGRLGGGECGYASDADVLFVHDPHEGVPEAEAQQQAVEVVQTLIRLADQKGPDLPVLLDASLRPEGKSGPIVRSLAAYRTYYARWSLVWEAQALLRAAPVAGDEALGRRFVELVDPIRWPEGGIGPQGVREVRLLKARMESERLPRGADKRTHLKLGPGGLSDVEWTVQLLQLEHAHEVEGLRTTSTLDALRAALSAELLSEEDAASLRNAWDLASRIRDAATLHRGKGVDALPGEAQDANGVARILGMPPGSGQLLADQWLRVARRARVATDRSFYAHPPAPTPHG